MSAGSYTLTTLQNAIDALSSRLDDSSQVHWVPDELKAYISESLQTFGAVTGAFRGRGVFATANLTAFYDLPTVLPSLRAYTMTDQQMVNLLEYHLLEPQSTGTAWSGTEQFTLADLGAAVQRRRDQFLRETGIVVTRRVLAVPPSPDGRVNLPESIEAIRRVAWLDLFGVVTPLSRSDTWGFVNFAVGIPQLPGRPPQAYATSDTPPLQFQLGPAPLDIGALDLVSVESGAGIDLTNPRPLGVPDDWAWVVKFGALADLLGRDGLCYDPERAAYCEARWQQGLTLVKSAAVVLAARINNVPCLVGSLSGADAFAPTWQTVPGFPTAVLLAGHNLIAVAPPPGIPVGGGNFAVTLDVVCNTPVPRQVNQPIQIGTELLDAVLDYAQHLATFKLGPTQLEASQNLFDRFAHATGATLQLQQASQPQRTSLFGQTAQDERQQARELEVPQ